MEHEKSTQSLQLTQLKKLYSKDINSPRTLERIKNFNDLVLVLTDRDILSFLVDGSKDIDEVTAYDLFEAAELRTQIIDNYREAGKTVDDKIAACIYLDWQTLALKCKVNPSTCSAASDQDSAKNLVQTLRKNWGQISEKEFYFRLLQTVKACDLDQIYSKIIELQKKVRGN